MTRTEFASVVAYIALGTGKSLVAESAEVYFDCLGDLDFDAMKLAAKRVLIEHRYPTFPTVAELREACMSVARGAVVDLSPAEAWAIAWRVVGDTDPEIEGSFSRAVAKAKAPPIVVEAIRIFGLNAMAYGKDPIGVIRGQFLAIFGQLQSSSRRREILPEMLIKSIESRANVAKAIEGIGIRPVL